MTKPTLSTKELDTLVSYCDLAVRQGGLNVAADALALAQKLLSMKAADAPTTPPE